MFILGFFLQAETFEVINNSWLVGVRLLFHMCIDAHRELYVCKTPLFYPQRAAAVTRFIVKPPVVYYVNAQRL